MANYANYKIQTQKDASFSLKLGVNICGYMFTGTAEKNGNFVNISAYADFALDLEKFLNAAAKRFSLTLDIPKIFSIIVERLRVDYIKGVLSFECEFEGFLKKCRFCYEKNSADYLFAFTIEDFNLKEIPFLIEFVGDSTFGLTDTAIIFSTNAAQYENIDVQTGLSLSANLCGFKFVQLIKSYTKVKSNENTQINCVDEKNTTLLKNADAKVFWIEINKQFSVLTLHRAGFSYDDGNLEIMIDLSVSIKPFTLSLIGAGLQVNIGNKDVKFLISGLGVEFDNGFLTIGGAFKKSGDKYSGALTIGVKTFKITLVGIYEQGHLLAYALVNANLGGSPAFFVTGIAAAFGYNKSIVLPEINDVPKFPLVAAAIGNPHTTLAEMIEKMEDGFIIDSEGQKFVSAGIKFTTFNMMESFVLLNVGFGNKVTFSILGTSNISVPPMVNKNPIAFAQLSLKSVLDPSEGIFSVQAQLTPESYIFSKNCKLMGGFALFIWFGSNPNCGDFVISLGGYHPDYKKPSHYPDVPRIGMDWQISSHLSISGEIYFALTPSCIMAGVRMSAIYKDGNLKAWFIAQADFMIQWKPFKYTANLCISLGASYTVNFLFVHHTFTVELSADISIWGPEFSGKAHISWFIISFTIRFGDTDDSPSPPLNYDEFSESFLPVKKNSETNKVSDLCSTQYEPLTISINGKISNEKDNVKYVNADGLSFLVLSAVPISDGHVVIRPMGDAAFTSRITFDAGVANCTKEDFFQSVPTAMWGGKGELRQVQSGYIVSFPETIIKTFPENQFISLDELYKLNTQTYKGYKFQPTEKINYSDYETIKIFADTADKVNESRKVFLKKMGIKSPPDISLSIYAQNAEILFDENFLTAI